MTNIIEFKLHIGDFLGGTLQMDATETGAYIMLLVAHYQAGENGLPDDDALLARIAKVTPNVWQKRIRENVLEKKFDKISTEKGDFFVQKRVVDNLKKITKISSNFYSNQLEFKDAPPENGRDNLQPSNHHEVNNFKLPVLDAARESRTVPAAGGGYRVMDWLNEDDLQAARAAAPGWDIGALARVFDAGIADRTRNMPKNPRNPGKYFVGFCRMYTKGKRP